MAKKPLRNCFKCGQDLMITHNLIGHICDRCGQKESQSFFRCSNCDVDICFKCEPKITYFPINVESQHGCALKYYGLERKGGTWRCDGTQLPGGCFGRANQFGLHPTIHRYRCDDHDYDLCQFCFLNQNGRNDVENNPIVNNKFKILVVGTLGTGKSTILNRLIGKQAFKTSNQAATVTRNFQKACYDDYEFCDSPGLNDPMDPKDGGIDFQLWKQLFYRAGPFYFNLVIVVAEAKCRASNDDLRLIIQNIRGLFKNLKRESIAVLWTQKDKAGGTFESANMTKILDIAFKTDKDLQPNITNCIATVGIPNTSEPITGQNTLLQWINICRKNAKQAWLQNGEQLKDYLIWKKKIAKEIESEPKVRKKFEFHSCPLALTSPQVRILIYGNQNYRKYACNFCQKTYWGFSYWCKTHFYDICFFCMRERNHISYCPHESWSCVGHDKRSGRGIFGGHWECKHRGCHYNDAAWMWSSIPNDTTCYKRCQHCSKLIYMKPK